MSNSAACSGPALVLGESPTADDRRRHDNWYRHPFFMTSLNLEPSLPVAEELEHISNTQVLIPHTNQLSDAYVSQRVDDWGIWHKPFEASALPAQWRGGYCIFKKPACLEPKALPQAVLPLKIACCSSPCDYSNPYSIAPLLEACSNPYRTVKTEPSSLNAERRALPVRCRRPGRFCPRAFPPTPQRRGGRRFPPAGG